ncbi:winged helix-turn-helix domain-containing protein [Methylobacterium sp. J-026]|uniref:winged helix-turn-helix domain-containing protein n=1 Tax=Methylobacterium sp. J-026 TaxID=2836624 RepID=UPI001FBA4AA6|nr:winged helix-turn-helix domain-containing protein [Methylobacterium sp. J-026]MCJ2135273.1 winged helix-turn-helix domain-containing protein [Methylobacterium sp. J-026]
MGLSDAEIAMRLEALRRQREALDRDIADLILYRDLGRRLGAGAATRDRTPEPGAGPADGPAPEPVPLPAPPIAARASGGGSSGTAETRGAVPPAVAFTEDAAGARRYGRALVQAACTAIAQAGRPLHAAEILERLLGQGFTLPGRDPVAALNTRLWKRSGPGGPLRRVGEATYALATPDSTPA